jgi:hypothetical protein
MDEWIDGLMDDGIIGLMDGETEERLERLNSGMIVR